MGFPPASRLPQRDILHHYHSSLLLVHFALNEGPEGPGRLRRYLETYRRSIEESGINDLELPRRIASDEDREKLENMLRQRMVSQREGLEEAHDALAAGRDEIAFFRDLERFYASRGIFLKREEATKN